MVVEKPLGIIELIGPPGAGKTTFLKMLKGQNGNIQDYATPYFRDIFYFPFFARNAFLLLPILLKLRLTNKNASPTNRDVAIMTILQGWDSILMEETKKHKTIVLDEGAIGLLAKLNNTDSNYLNTQIAQIWMMRTYAKWANTINLVIYLDAPIPVLIKRIRTRIEQFEMKRMSNIEMAEHLANIRTSLEQTLLTLKTCVNCPPIYYFNTVNKTQNQICDDVLEKIC